MKFSKGCSRSVKVATEIKRIVSDYLIRGKNEDSGDVDPFMIVVTDVVVSSCLQHAKIFVSSMDGKCCDDYLDFLRSHSAQIRKTIGDNVRLKFVPKIDFVIDDSFEQAKRIDDLLSCIHKKEECV